MSRIRTKLYRFALVCTMLLLITALVGCQSQTQTLPVTVEEQAYFDTAMERGYFASLDGKLKATSPVTMIQMISALERSEDRYICALSEYRHEGVAGVSFDIAGKVLDIALGKAKLEELSLAVIQNEVLYSVRGIHNRDTEALPNLNVNDPVRALDLAGTLKCSIAVDNMSHAYDTPMFGYSADDHARESFTLHADAKDGLKAEHLDWAIECGFIDNCSAGDSMSGAKLAKALVLLEDTYVGFYQSLAESIHLGENVLYDRYQALGADAFGAFDGIPFFGGSFSWQTLVDDYGYRPREEVDDGRLSSIYCEPSHPDGGMSILFSPIDGTLQAPTPFRMENIPIATIYVMADSRDGEKMPVTFAGLDIATMTIDDVLRVYGEPDFEYTEPSKVAYAVSDYQLLSFTFSNEDGLLTVAQMAWRTPEYVESTVSASMSRAEKKVRKQEEAHTALDMPLYNGNDVFISLVNFYAGAEQTEFTLRIRNNGQNGSVVQPALCRVNGVELNPLLSATVDGHGDAEDALMVITQAQLDEAGVDIIKVMDVQFRVIDADSYTEQFVTDETTILDMDNILTAVTVMEDTKS